MAVVNITANDATTQRHRPLGAGDTFPFVMPAPIITRHNTANTNIIISTPHRIVHLVAGHTGVVVLPAAAASLGYMVTISNHRATAVTITGGPVRSGAATTITSVPSSGEYTFTSDGTEWFMISN